MILVAVPPPFGFVSLAVIVVFNTLSGIAGRIVLLVGRVPTDGDWLVVATAIAPCARLMVGAAGQPPPAFTPIIPAYKYKHE